MTERLSITRHGAVAEIRMDRPEVHNAFDARLIAELTAALDAFAIDASVRVVVLGGTKSVPSAPNPCSQITLHCGLRPVSRSMVSGREGMGVTQF